MDTQTRNIPYTMPLALLTRADVPFVGAKAANLGELAKHGFPVPDGFALTTQAFDSFIKANGLDETASPEKVAQAELPIDVQNALRVAAVKLNGTPLAIRSSGVAEDLEGASFAGQYESILGARGYDALQDAVRQCWASAFSARVAAYKNGKGQNGSASMAVLVQILVNADAAGVAFTANPVNGRHDETVVSAVRGLGERLVSGDASPDEWIVRGQDATRNSAPENAIDAEQARQIAEMARRAEAHFGSPQDVEWAIRDGKLFMLQARPITTLREPEIEPVPMKFEVPEGYWESDAEHLPKPVSPMGRTVMIPSFTHGTERMCTTLGLLLERFQYRDIGGWTYLRLVPPGGTDRTPPPAPIMKLMLSIVPGLRARVRRATEFVNNHEADILVERWYSEWYPELSKKIVELRAVDLTQLSDGELDAHLSRAIEITMRGAEMHFTLGAVNPFVIYNLVAACQELLGWDEGKAMELVAGLSTKSTEPARKLAELAAMARTRPAVSKLIEQSQPLEEIRQADPEFAAAFDRYLREYGCRGLAFDLVEPTIAESPALVLGWLRNQMANNYDPEADETKLADRRTAAQAAARLVLAQRPVMERERFEQVLSGAARGYPTQEDNVFFTQGVPLALCRYALLEMGNRLAQRQVIERRDDIFFLELEEARSAFQKGGDQRSLVRQRKGERAWAELHHGPATYGKPPAQPPLSALPPAPQYMMKVVPWYLERALSTGRGRVQQAGQRLTGIGASAGKYTGTVRVILNEKEFGKLQPGDVLVCPATTPMWSVLFSNVGALVTNTGGILSHPAIIAREYRVPAVVATGNATSLLRDGQLVTVDGDSGCVEVQ
jgi:rifampicin phosphotransferase